MFQNNYWYLIKLFKTALMMASMNGHTEIVKLFLEQEGNEINAKNIYLISSKFQSIIRYSKRIIGI